MYDSPEMDIVFETLEMVNEAGTLDELSMNSERTPRNKEISQRGNKENTPLTTAKQRKTPPTSEEARRKEVMEYEG